MRRGVQWSGVIIAILAVVVMMLPQLVKAEVQSEVTEVADFAPYSNDYTESVNLANESIRFNIDTWTPLPTGIFVGGTIEESLIQLNEIAGGYNAQMMLTTKVRFSQDYLGGGCSDFYVRLPVDMTVDIHHATFGLLRDFGSYNIIIDSAHIFVDSTGTPGRAVVWDRNMGIGLTNPTGPVYVQDNRLYAHYNAPVYPNVDYLLMAWFALDNGTTVDAQPFNSYICAGDLASDNYAESTISYCFQTAPDQMTFQSFDVPADLGWSFVFAQGIGGSGIIIDRYFNAGEVLRFYPTVQVNSATPNGSTNLVLDFLTDTFGNQLNYTLQLKDHMSPPKTYILNPTYWTSPVVGYVTDYLIASNPVNLSYSTDMTAGKYWINFDFLLTFLTPIRLRFVMVDSASDNVNYWLQCSDITGAAITDAGMARDGFTTLNTGTDYFAPELERWFFTLFLSISIDDWSWNKTGTTVSYTHKMGFWEGVWHGIEKHWEDIVGGFLIVGGVILVLTGVGAGFGLAYIAAGIGILLYEHWGDFRDFVDKVFKMFIDGLTWLGKWLAKIVGYIWKALTWFIDQLIDFGSTVLAMVIYGLALLVPIFIITMFTKMMSAFYKIAKGDVEGAASDARGVVEQATFGRVG